MGDGMLSRDELLKRAAVLGAARLLAGLGLDRPARPIDPLVAESGSPPRTLDWRRVRGQSQGLPGAVLRATVTRARPEPPPVPVHARPRGATRSRQLNRGPRAAGRRPRRIRTSATIRDFAESGFFQPWTPSKIPNLEARSDIGDGQSRSAKSQGRYGALCQDGLVETELSQGEVDANGADLRRAHAGKIGGSTTRPVRLTRTADEPPSENCLGRSSGHGVELPSRHRPEARYGVRSTSAGVRHVARRPGEGSPGLPARSARRRSRSACRTRRTCRLERIVGAVRERAPSSVRRTAPGAGCRDMPPSTATQVVAAAALDDADAVERDVRARPTRERPGSKIASRARRAPGSATRRGRARSPPGSAALGRRACSGSPSPPPRLTIAGVQSSAAQNAASSSIAAPHRRVVHQLRAEVDVQAEHLEPRRTGRCSMISAASSSGTPNFDPRCPVMIFSCVSASIPGVIRSSTRFTPNSTHRSTSPGSSITTSHASFSAAKLQLLVRLVVAVDDPVGRRDAGGLRVHHLAEGRDVGADAFLPEDLHDLDVRERLRAVDDRRVRGARPPRARRVRGSSPRSTRTAACRTPPRARPSSSRRSTARRRGSPPCRETAGAVR